MKIEPIRALYGVYVWVTFVVLALCTTFLLLFVPGLERRRRLTRAAARATLRMAGMPLVVKSLQCIPSGQCVIVANHASYLDGLVMTAALPPRFGFVIKREMSRVPLAGLLLRRIGSLFVERFNRHKGANDARRIVRTAVDGHSLVFFPEGTFSLQPGLLKFHTGAFVTAARAGCPVVPAVVRGTRRALPPQRRLPRPARIEVEFLPALHVAAGSPANPTVELRDRARSAILTQLQEPDLSSPYPSPLVGEGQG
jgi:1-acyl-sn-glycerol-3-phosphate acyltransferase